MKQIALWSLWICGIEETALTASWDSSFAEVHVGRHILVVSIA